MPALRMVLLGVAQDAGVPQAGCTCANCSDTWAGRLPRQFAVCAALVDPGSCSCWLLDCTPDFRDQYHLLQVWLASQGLSDCKLVGVLLTHLHVGHYAGLLQFGREVMDWRGLQVFGTPSVLGLFTHAPWKQYLEAGNFRLMAPLVPGQRVQLSETLSATPVAVPHRGELSDTVAFHVQGPSKSAFWLPDIDSWDAWAAAGTDVKQVVESVDVAFLDACFYDGAELPGRYMSLIPHPLVTHTMQRLAGAAATKVVLIHLNHTNPVWREDSEQHRAVVQAGFRVGQQGAAYQL